MKKRSGVLAAAVAAALVTAGTAKADWLIKGIPGTPGTSIHDYTSADNLINGTNGFTNQPGFPAVTTHDYWNWADEVSNGSFHTIGDGSAFDVADIRPPGLTGAPGSNDDYVVVGAGNVITNAGGPTLFKFTTNSDDGARLIIDGVHVVDVNKLQGPTDDSGTITLDDGSHTINYMHFERGGGAEAELSVEIPGVTPRTILSKAGKLTGAADGSQNGIFLDDSTTVTTYKSVVVNGQFQNSGPVNLANAIAAKGGAGTGSAILHTFNLSNDGGNPAPNQSGRFGGDVDVPGIARGSDNYIAVGTGKLIVPADGDYYFVFLSDDGNQLSIDGVPVIHDETQHGASPGPDDRFSNAVHLTAGAHDIEAIFFENGGGSGGEVALTNAAHDTFCLLGADGCLDVVQAVPEPTSMAVLGLGAIGLLARRRRA
jgi:hypothetical protein